MIHHDTTVYSRTIDGFVRYSEDPYGYFPAKATDWEPTTTSIPVHSTHITATHYGIRRTLQPYNPPETERIPATFEQHVDTLPQWERDLLDQVVFDVSPFQLVTMFTHMANFDTSAALEIQFVSDGSQIRDRMSFGWCLALPNGTRLAHCSGPGFGPGTSHQAAGYGVLSAVRFIYQLIFFTNSSSLASLFHNR
jgi:hypothetical protein